MVHPSHDTLSLAVHTSGDCNSTSKCAANGKHSLKHTCTKHPAEPQTSHLDVASCIATVDCIQLSSWGSVNYMTHRHPLSWLIRNNHTHTQFTQYKSMIIIDYLCIANLRIAEPVFALAGCQGRQWIIFNTCISISFNIYNTSSWRLEAFKTDSHCTSALMRRHFSSLMIRTAELEPVWRCIPCGCAGHRKLVSIGISNRPTGTLRK